MGDVAISMEPPVGIEPTTPSLPWKCSTSELGRPNTLVNILSKRSLLCKRKAKSASGSQ